MKHADSVSGGGFLSTAMQHQPSETPPRSAVQRTGESLLVPGLALAGVSAGAYGLWYAYRLLEGVFAQALLPVPAALFPITAGVVLIGAFLAVVGLVMRRTGTPARATARERLPEEYGRAA